MNHSFTKNHLFCSSLSAFLKCIYISIIPRNDFQKLGEDLKLAKGRDMLRYNKIVEDVNESYRKYGEVIFLSLTTLHIVISYGGTFFDMPLKIELNY